MKEDGDITLAQSAVKWLMLNLKVKQQAHTLLTKS